MVASSKTMVSLYVSLISSGKPSSIWNPSFHINLCWVSAFFFPCRAEDLFPALRGRIGHGALQYGELQCVALPHPSAGLALRVGWLWCDRRCTHRSGGGTGWNLQHGGFMVVERWLNGVIIVIWWGLTVDLKGMMWDISPTIHYVTCLKTMVILPNWQFELWKINWNWGYSIFAQTQASICQ